MDPEAPSSPKPPSLAILQEKVQAECWPGDRCKGKKKNLTPVTTSAGCKPHPHRGMAEAIHPRSDFSQQPNEFCCKRCPRLIQFTEQTSPCCDTQSSTELRCCSPLPHKQSLSMEQRCWKIFWWKGAFILSLKKKHISNFVCISADQGDLFLLSPNTQRPAFHSFQQLPESLQTLVQKAEGSQGVCQAPGAHDQIAHSSKRNDRTKET